MAVLLPATAGSDDVEYAEPRAAALAPLSHLIAAIPPPPAPPRPPAWLEAPETAAEAGGGADELGEPGRPEGTLPDRAEPQASRVVDGPLFEEPGPEAPTFAKPDTSIRPYPIVINPQVEASIDYFTARQRERFGIWLERSGRYLGMIREVLGERGLPEELAYTAMVESGFNPRARSRAGATGLWQFMTATARRYGLTVNRWVDERLDPVKSTIAAAEYLRDLYGMFEHWFLAQAAYNAGEARVARAIRQTGSRDFWALVRTRHLPRETKRFVPKILAATLIAREPARYGFEERREPALVYDSVTVTRSVDLHTVAVLLDVPLDELRSLNPALRSGITPPRREYPLRVPSGSGLRLQALLEEPSALPVWGFHRVRGGESLSEIGRLYRTSPERLAEVNRLRGGRMRGSKALLVPVSRRIEVKTRPGGTPTDREATEVVVRRGDTLWEIARRHGMELGALARLNGRDPHAPLYPGERLTIHVP